jgi:hypothetical protein
LHKEYDFSEVLGVMYLLIMAPMLPEGLIYLALTGMSLVDRLVSLNFIVASSKLLALNLDMPPLY